MSRYRHHCAGAVFHQHEIGQVDGNIFARKQVAAVGAGKNALLLALLSAPLCLADFFVAIDERLDRRFLRRAAREFSS